MNTEFDELVVAITVPVSTDMRPDRETEAVHGTEAWHAGRSGRTIGSSEVAAVFRGEISKTVTRRQLIDKLNGIKRTVTPYAQAIFDAGTAWEPVLLAEFERRFVGCWLYHPKQYVCSETLHGIREVSTTDGVAFFMKGGQLRVCIVEIKWRARAKNDCGWGENEDELGLTVWCQAQHQMKVTGIHAAMVYTGGCFAGEHKRRAWSISYCRAFNELVFPCALLEVVNEADGVPAPAGPNYTPAVIRTKLNKYMDSTSCPIDLK